MASRKRKAHADDSKKPRKKPKTAKKAKTVQEAFVAIQRMDKLTRLLRERATDRKFKDVQGRTTRLPTTLKAITALGIDNVRTAACQLLQWSDLGIDSEQTAADRVRESKQNKKQRRQEMAQLRRETAQWKADEAAREAAVKAQLDSDWKCLLRPVTPGLISRAWVRFPVDCDAVPDWDGPPQPKFKYSYSPLRVRLTAVRADHHQIDIELLEPFAASYDLNFCRGLWRAQWQLQLTAPSQLTGLTRRNTGFELELHHARLIKTEWDAMEVRRRPDGEVVLTIRRTDLAALFVQQTFASVFDHSSLNKPLQALILNYACDDDDDPSFS
jgi:hypothetical protein